MILEWVGSWCINSDGVSLNSKKLYSNSMGTCILSSTSEGQGISFAVILWLSQEQYRLILDSNNDKNVEIVSV